MALTNAQSAALKADILSKSGVGGPLETMLAQADYSGIVAFYNALAVPDFLAWRTEASTRDMFDAIDWGKYTPVDAADNTVTFSNRLLIIQTKQMNLQNMLIGRSSVDATKANIRSGLRDAVIQLPAGAGGALVTAGGASGVTVLNACTRKSSVLEKLLTTGPATTGSVTADILGFEGAILFDELVNIVRN